MDAYHNLAVSYDRLTNDVDYEATVDFYYEILEREGLKPRTCVDLACGTGSVTAILARKGLQVTAVDSLDSRAGPERIALNCSGHKSGVQMMPTMRLAPWLDLGRLHGL